MSTRIFAIAIVGLIVATVYAANSPVTVNLLDAKGQSVGTANLTQSKGGVVIRLNLKNLPTGGHAPHIHSAAKCEAPAFKSAFRTSTQNTSSMALGNPQGPHAGDIAQLYGEARWDRQDDFGTRA